MTGTHGSNPARFSQQSGLRCSRRDFRPTIRPSLLLELLLASFLPCVIEVRQLSPIGPGINPDRAVGAKGDDFAGCQRRDLFDFPGPMNLRWVGLRHHGSV
jgi:hypothetical protein